MDKEPKTYKTRGGKRYYFQGSVTKRRKTSLNEMIVPWMSKRGVMYGVYRKP